MWGIWDEVMEDWLRLFGKATFAFESREDAERAAMEQWGYDSYALAHREGWCEVRRLPPPADMTAALKETLSALREYTDGNETEAQRGILDRAEAALNITGE